MIAEPKIDMARLATRASNLLSRDDVKTLSLAHRATAILIKSRNSYELTDDQKSELKKHDKARDAAKIIYEQAAIAAAAAQAKAEKKKKRERETEIAAILLFLLLAGEDAYEKTYSTMGKTDLKSADETQIKEQSRTFSNDRQKNLKGYAEKLADATAKAQADAEKEKLDEVATAREIREMAKTVSDTMAETESQGAYGAVQIDRLKRAGFKKKIWATMEDERVRESHVDCGEQGAIELGKKFVNGLLYPGDPNGSAAEVCNCRCYLIGER